MTKARGYKWQNIGARIREARKKVGADPGPGEQAGRSQPPRRLVLGGGEDKASHEHLLELAYRCEVSTDWILGRDVVEAELLKEADVSFSNAISGLPTEDVESIMEFIRFVRERRRRT